MNVLIADRKGISPGSVRPGRTDFITALKTSTVIILTLPLSPSTTNLISAPEFAIMRPDAILINVSRGGIVDEDELVKAIKEKKIRGAATDVFVEEPAGRENVLVKCVEEFHENKNGEWDGMEGRLVVSPHVAWFAGSSIEKLRRTVVENVEGWSRGKPQNLVE
jgi:lactate dehydrogenase-like 2-hydroxyacid dehydrogenase